MLLPSVGERDWVEGENGRVYQEWSTGGSSALYDTKLSNVVDKFVFVENTGNTGAYVRTVFAFESGDWNKEEFDKLVHTNLNGTHWTWEDENISIVIDGQTYFVISAVYTGSDTVHTGGVLPGGSTTRPSLLQYDLDSTTTSDDIASLGSSYEILVVSQAVQVNGTDAATALEEAFGEVTEDNAAEWFKGAVTVAAPASGAVRPAGIVPQDGVAINGVTIVDNSDDATNLRALYNGEKKADYVTKDMVITDSYLDGTYAMNVYAVADSGAKLIVTDTTLKGWVSYDGFASASFTDCRFDMNSSKEFYKTVRPYAETTLTNCDFAEGYEFWLDKLNGEKITLKNCTLNGEKIISADQLNIVYGDAGSVVIDNK
ncbi:MAG: hypothetical protein II341_04025 [Oscillospiraceae bacterium]|nr:hypothetical protein [Oscillospiraceae bacterium]